MGPTEFEDLLYSLQLVGASIEGLGWTDDLRTFQVDLADGRSVLFEDCLQANFLRPPSGPTPRVIGAYWTDEPSPLIQTLRPELRFLYHHLVLEIGEATLRLAFREILLAEDLEAESDGFEGPEPNGRSGN